MARDENGDCDFALIRRIFEAVAGEFKQATTDAAASGRLIASAEYELELVKEAFAASRLPT